MHGRGKAARFIRGFLVLCLLFAAGAGPAVASYGGSGHGKIAIKLEQWPAAGKLDSLSVGSATCLVEIPYRGVLSSP